MNMKMMSLVACCLLAFAATPVDAQTIQSRSFTDAASFQVAFQPNGAGIFDTSDPTNTCIALLQVNVGGSALLLFYLNGRTVVEGAMRVFGGTQSTADALGSNPADPTDCAGLANPGGEIGADGSTHRTGGFFTNIPVLSNAHLPATEALEFNMCAIGDAPVLAVGDNLASCGGSSSAAGDSLFAGSGVLGSRWDEDFYAADIGTVGNGISESGIIEACVSADVFDGISAFVSVSDSDYFGAISYEDIRFQNTGDIQATALVSADPTQWSAINSNGPGATCGTTNTPPPETFAPMCGETGVRDPFSGLMVITVYPCITPPDCQPAPQWAVSLRVVGPIGSSVTGSLFCNSVLAGSVACGPTTAADLGNRACAGTVVSGAGPGVECRSTAVGGPTVSWILKCVPDP